MILMGVQTNKFENEWDKQLSQRPGGIKVLFNIKHSEKTGEPVKSKTNHIF